MCPFIHVFSNSSIQLCSSLKESSQAQATALVKGNSYSTHTPTPTMGREKQWIKSSQVGTEPMPNLSLVECV